MRNAPARIRAIADRGAEPAGPQTALGRVERTKQVVQIADLKTEPQYKAGDPFAVTGVELGGIRTLVCADAQGWRADRRDQYLSPGGTPLHRQADRAGAELRRAGRHRHREHAAAQRAARIACSSRPRPPRCSRSSVARRAICSLCSTPCWKTPRASARPTFGNLWLYRRRVVSHVAAAATYRTGLRNVGSSSP